MIELQNLRKVYPSQPNYPVLKGVSLSVDNGEFLSIVGTSGSGKTTLLNIIGGLDSHFEGSARVDDLELKALSDKDLSHFRNRSVGFVFQSFNLLEHLTCGENVQLPAYFSGTLTKDDMDFRARECLDAVGLIHKYDQKPLNLSGGERQRIAIARALFNKPRVFLCDEPTGALDTKTGERILSLFESLNRDTGITLIIVTHDLEVSQRADRVIRIEDGHIVQDERLRTREPKDDENAAHSAVEVDG
jgi:putative ABC transport system ATP-binding protein